MRSPSLLGHVSTAVVALSLICFVSRAGAEGGFVGESRCANPTCHGAALPSSEAARKDWRPWKSARTQWLNRNIDRHSRAYATLETEGGKTIARYMAIDATRSEKCTICHAPAARTAGESRHRVQDGVSCEHCHGPAEAWLKDHVEKDWPQKRASYVAKGFYDNDDYRRRAENCARCHVQIDHEIVAGGHPPLQFEMVAYAQIMKHWDDQDELPPGAFSVDPTLWSVGQIVGLRSALEMVARRSGGESHEALGKFAGFKDANCSQCHHKLIADGLRQAQGHYLMTEVVMSVLFPDARGQLTRRWNETAAAARSSAEATHDKAQSFAQWLTSFEQQVAGRKVDAAAARKLLAGVTAGGERFRDVETFAHGRPAGANVLRIDNIDLPWWYTAGAPEQSILAIESLCAPALGAKCATIDGELRQLLAAVNRAAYDPEKFSKALSAVNRKLFP